MAQYETYTNKFFSTDFMKGLMPANSLFPVDFSALMEIQRKNLQAVSEIQQAAVESIQAIAQRQAALLSQIAEDNTTIAQQIMAEGTPEEKVARQADLVRKAYENSLSNINDLSDLVSKSGRDATEIISRRVTASLTEFKSTVEKAKPKSGSAKAA